MKPAAHPASESMAQRQSATPPGWLGRSRGRLLRDVLGGPWQNWDKLVQLLGFLAALLWPPLVRARLRRLRQLGHVDVEPTIAQMLVASRDQMMLGAAEETKIFYESQGIPWVFHNFRRVISGPATMIDPMGLFSTRDAIILHVLQTFHRHPLYDLVLLRAYPDGLQEMQRQTEALLAGQHPHGRALESLIEDGSYHQRLPADIASVMADPFQSARPVPAGLVADPLLMVAMDQFKDISGFCRYAARLRVGLDGALGAWLTVAWNETLGGLLRVRLGPRRPRLSACDPDVVARHGLGPDAASA